MNDGPGVVDQGAKGVVRSLAAKYGFFSLCIVFLLGLYGYGAKGDRLVGSVLRVDGWPSALGGAIVVPAGSFIVLFLVISCFGLATLIAFPSDISRRKAEWWIVLLALACRLLVFPHAPSDDLNRYLWEGRVVASGLSPYEHAPIADDDGEAEYLRSSEDPYWAKINHPTMTAIYPPMILLLFGGVSSLWYDPFAIKITMTGFDLAALFLILRILKSRSLAPRWALIYAISPLVVYAFAGRGHLDAVQIFFLLLALLSYRRERWRSMFVVLACAAQAKYLALLGVPLFVRRENVRHAWLFLVVFSAPFLPFVTEGGGGIFRSLTTFGREFAFNGAIHGILREGLGSLEWATWWSAMGFTVAWLMGIWSYHPGRSSRLDPDPMRGLFFVLGAFLLFSPTVHFWYVAAILPFVCFRPSASWILLAATIVFSLVAEGTAKQTGAWELPSWAHLLVWLPPGILLGRDGWLAWRRRRRRRSWPPPRTVSAVIPCINEAEAIAGCIESIQRSQCVTEVIVVDGGSSDGTAELAEKAGARVIEVRRPVENGGGRGGRIWEGARSAKGDVVVIVHADTRLDDGAMDRIVHTLAQNPDFFGGSLGARFGASGAKLRALEYANHLRAAFMGLSFGDQVQFFRNDPNLTPQLVPNIPLMEDVELAMRFHLFGRSTYLWGGSTASARRWRLGAWSRMCMVLRLVSGYLMARLIAPPNTVGMYYRYYGRPPSSTMSSRESRE